MDIKIIEFHEAEQTVPLEQEVTRREFQVARNSMWTTCRPFGTVGSMGLYPLADRKLDDEEESRWSDDWPYAGSDTDVYLFSSPPEDNGRYLIMSTKPHVLTPAFLAAVVDKLREMKDWAVLLEGVGNYNLMLVPAGVGVPIELQSLGVTDIPSLVSIGSHLIEERQREMND